MKNAVICAIMLIILVLTGATIYAIEGKTTRQNELDANLSSAMERSMEIMTIDPTYTISREDNEHLIADFIMNFLMRMSSNSDFQIDVLGVDAEKGLLSVRVTETFPSLLFESTVTATRTIILEDYDNSGDEYFAVTFYDEYSDGEFKNPFKQVQVYGGSSLKGLNPVDPIKDGYTFKGWKLASKNDTTGKFEVLNNTYTSFDDLKVSQELRFVANWKPDDDGIYTVTFYANNQVYTMKKVAKNAAIGEVGVPIKEGYTFKGWSAPQENTLSSEEIAKKKIDRHIKYTAVFEENE